MKKIVLDKRKLRPLTPSVNYFQSLVRSIIFQQLSGKAAQSILNKFTALFPKRFPKPEEVLLVTDEQFRQSGISRTKMVYIRDLATKFIDKTIVPKQFSKMSDEDIKAHLTRVKGIGSWTADMFLIFALNRPNVLPVGDLAIRKGFQRLFQLPQEPSEAKMRELAKPYEGKYTYLALYLWDSLDNT